MKEFIKEIKESMAIIDYIIISFLSVMLFINIYHGNWDAAIINMIFMLIIFVFIANQTVMDSMRNLNSEILKDYSEYIEEYSGLKQVTRKFIEASHNLHLKNSRKKDTLMNYDDYVKQLRAETDRLIIEHNEKVRKNATK